MRTPIVKTAASVALAVAGLLMFTLVALAVHDLGLFELDRNAQDPGGGPLPDDWATLYGGGGNAEEFTGVLPDIGSDGGTQFQGGGSKDDLDITQWLWKLGEPLDKDDITNAYSAAYLNAVDTGNNNVDDLILYFGLDRFSANGSAQVGFWFLQDPNFGLTNIPQSGGFKFSGVHMDNDILVQSNFSGGGVIDRITVYKWLAGALVPVLTAADCIGPPASPADDAACATVNRNPQPAPWPYTPKANEGSPGTFLTGAFFEGGINISRLVPDAGCFTGFLAETRTSTPFDARLKDFVRGSLELCSANIQIEADDTNEVGAPHTFTVTVNQVIAGVSSAATVGNVDVTLTGSNGAVAVLDGASSTCDDFQPSGDNLDASGQCTIAFTSNSAGQVTGHASATVPILGDNFFVETDGASPNSDDAVKTYVDARITITPSETNEVGASHTFTVDVDKDAGDGLGFVAATVGNVDITLTDSNGAVSVLHAAASTCDDAGNNLDASGQCIIVFSSPTAGKVTGNASVTLSVGGVSLTRDTDPATALIGAGPGGSGPAVKTYVDARITITPSQTNEVGASHTFTVDVDKNAGDGLGFVAATPGDVDFTLVNSNGAAYALNAGASTCDEAGDNLDASGQCTIVFSSPTAGKVTGNASVTLSVGGVSLTRDTDPATALIGAGPGGSGPAVKTYVDAWITIAPDDTDNITEQHAFTVTVKANDGSGSGFQDAPDNTPVTVTLTPAGGASVLGVSDNCASPGTSSGTCTVTFHSDTAGTVTGHASVDITLSGLPLHRETDGNSPNSGDAVKTYIVGSLAWHKEDHLGNPLGGATFEVCRTHILDTSTDLDTMVDSSDDCFLVTDNSSPDADPADGEFLIEDLVLGRFTVREAAAPPGYTIDNPNAVTAPDMSLAVPDIEIETPFTNSPPLEGCTPGWWKNRGLGAWDEPTDPLAIAVANAVFDKWGNVVDGTTGSLFSDVFDLTAAEMTARGLDPNLTLLGAVEIGGGGFAALARQGTSALLNSLSVDYAYSADSVLQAVHDAFVSGDLGSLVDDYDTANNRGHGSCPTGS